MTDDGERTEGMETEAGRGRETASPRSVRTMPQEAGERRSDPDPTGTTPNGTAPGRPSQERSAAPSAGDPQTRSEPRPLPPKEPRHPSGTIVLSPGPDAAAAGRLPSDVDRKVPEAPEGPDARTAADVDREAPGTDGPSGTASGRTGSDVDRKAPLRSLGHLRPMKGRKAPEPEVQAPGIEFEGGRIDAFPVFTGVLPATARLQPSDARLEEIRRGALASLKPKIKEAGSPTAKGTTRTLKTLSQYGIAADRLKKRYCRETRTNPDAISPGEFAAWFLSLRRNYKASSWRFNRQAAIFALESFLGEQDVNDAISLVENEARWDSQIDTPLNAPKADPVRKTVTSENKRRYFSYEDFERIEAHLRVNRHSEKTGILIDWLRAGIFTGLRPEEWRATEVRSVEDPKSRGGRLIYLFVLNAKATNGRGNGVMRTLNISSFTDTTLASVEIMSRKGAEWYQAGDYSNVQSQVAQHLYRTQERLFKRRKELYSLYSTRHQFVLNMRAIMRSDEEISALLGHNVTSTQATNYGLRSKGWSEDKILDKPTALVEEIATVRKTAGYGMERERLRRLAAGKTDLPTADDFSDGDFDPSFSG